MPNDDQIKVSQLPEASSQTGLWVLGVDSNDQSCKFQASLLQGPQGQPGADGNPGQPGADGNSAGFGTPQASVDGNTGTPEVTISMSGPDTAKVFEFTFKNLKGAQGSPGVAGANGQSAVRSLVTHTASETSVTGLAWDTVHKWGEMASLTFTLASVPADGKEHTMVIIFDTPADVTNFALNYDSSILWNHNINPTTKWYGNSRYEIEISSASLIADFARAAKS